MSSVQKHLRRGLTLRIHQIREHGRTCVSGNKVILGRCPSAPENLVAGTSHGGLDEVRGSGSSTNKVAAGRKNSNIGGRVEGNRQTIVSRLAGPNRVG